MRCTPRTHPFGCPGGHTWGSPCKPSAEQRYLGTPPRGEQPPPSSWAPLLEKVALPPMETIGWALQAPSSARGWDTLPFQCVPPKKKGDLQKILSLREDTETDGADNRKASGAGAGGRTAELCSGTTRSCVTALLNRPPCRVLFTGDSLQEAARGAARGGHGAQHPQTPPQPSPRLQGSVRTGRVPLRED